jgi:hypothetical protein
MARTKAASAMANHADGNSMTEESSVTSSAKTPHDSASRSKGSSRSKKIPSVVEAASVRTQDELASLSRGSTRFRNEHARVDESPVPDEARKTIVTPINKESSPYGMMRQNDLAFLKTVICKDLFPKVKFATVSNMEYSSSPYSLSRVFAELCNVPPEEREQWWFGVKKVVRNTLSSQRTNKAAQMRLTFMSKWLYCHVCCLSIYS